MSSDIVAARGCGNTQVIETVAAGFQSVAGCGGTDDQFRRTRQILRCDAGIEAQTYGIEIDICVGEDLVEITYASRQLICDGVGKYPVIHQREIIDMDGSVLEVRRKLRGGWSRLGSLPDEPREGEVVLGSQLLIQLVN